MPLTHFRHFCKRGALNFEKFGQIDRVSDFPQGYALFMDCDTKNPDRLPQPAFIRWILTIIGIQSSSIVYRETKRGFHVIIRILEKLEPVELVAVQAILGDDPMRAALNLMRARQSEIMDDYWRTRWNILYDHKV
jgi:hypothetical protein